MSKNSYIIDKAFKTFLLASILTQLVQQLRILADGIIVSNKVGPSALSAINLYTPFETVFYALIMITVSGAGLLAAIEMGKQNYRRVSEFFSSTLIIVSAIISALVAASYFFLPEIVGWLSDIDEPQLYGQTMDYTRIMLFTYIIQVPNSALRAFVSIDGKPRLVTGSIIISFLLNVVLDILFVIVLDMGITGAAIATLISDTVGMLMLCRYMYSRECSFRLQMPKSFAILGESIRQGLPLQVPMLLVAVVFYLVNQIVLDIKGPEGAYLMAVIMQIMSLCAMVCEGFVELNTSIGGVLYGERDFSSFRKIVHNSYSMLMSFGLILTAAILLFPDAILMMFGDDGSVDSTLLTSQLRVISALFIPYMLFQFTANVHIIVGKENFATILLFAQAVAMVVLPYLFGQFAPDYFWHSFLVMILAVLAIQWITARYLHQKKALLTEYALLPLLPDDIATTFSVHYNNESVADTLEQISLFTEISELDSMTTNKVMLCCEELMYNLVQFGTDMNKDRTFDIRLSDLEDRFEVRIKDAGKPFDPVIRFDKTAAQAYTDGESMQLGLQIVNKMCDEIAHKFMFGLNVTTLSFRKAS